MTLEECNNKLIDLAAEYSEKVIEYYKLEHHYSLRFWDLILHSGLGNALAREAEANLICKEEGLLEPLQILKADIKKLQYEKECYLAISSNLRCLEVDKKV